MSSTKKYPRFSIVINTYNRISTLPATLNSLKYLRYPGEFEVIVVDGPSDDGTTELLKSWPEPIRLGKCALRNLSVSRNIGIAMAQGDIVAFIDDDAIPEADWLTHLAAAYEDKAVGAAGGRVYNPTGYEFQVQYLTVDRLGNSTDSSKPSPHLSYPYSWKFPQNMGTNASYRKDVLLEIGGFDEEFDYYLDETDVCTRVVDAGFIVAQLENAYIHHKFAKSHLRDERKILRDHTSVIKNKIYYSLLYAKEYMSEDEIMRDNYKFIDKHRCDVKWAIGENLMGLEELEKFEQRASFAVQKGMQLVHSNSPRKFLTQETINKYKGEFLPFLPVTQKTGKEIVLICKWYDKAGGLATYFRSLSQELAALGHTVHIICCHEENYSQVDLEDGVWIHRLIPEKFSLSEEAKLRRIPEDIWNWSYTALQECRRIEQHTHIDVIEAPLWDVEGCAFLLEGEWPLATFLVTSLALWLESKDDKRNDKNWMQNFGSPMINLEKEMMQKCDLALADSYGIVEDIERSYNFKFDKDKLEIVLLGIPPVPIVTTPSEGTIKIFFIGRLEERKGVDVLLEIAPKILSKYPNTELIIAGDNTIKIGKSTYKDLFIKSNKDNPDILSRVKFLGMVDEDRKKSLYNECDIFIAPSRFESFGLIFLEAMRVGKPVIGCKAGGMCDVVDHNVTGLLAEPGDTISLYEALSTLIENHALRSQMGQAGYERYLKKFTSRQMAINTLNVYNRIAFRSSCI